MNHKLAGRIFNYATVCGAMIILLAVLYYSDYGAATYIAIAVGAVIAAAGVFIGYKYARCPKCSKFLGIMATKERICPKCNTEL